MQNKTLYLFIDESGNFDFSAKGSKYFIATALATFDPVIGRENLVKLRYELLAQGNDQEFFHASEDRQIVRDEVFKILNTSVGSYEVHSVIAQKNKADPSLYKEIYQKDGKTISRVTGIGLYQQVCQTLLKYVFTGKANNIDTIVVVLASLAGGDKKKTILKTLKHFLKTNFPGIPFEIYSHASCADLNCQLADYCCWAISAKWERSELRSYVLIKPQIKNEFELFRKGKTEHYKY
jgi:hypothetical protein